ELKSITMVEHEMSEVALEQYLSHEDPLERPPVYEMEQMNSEKGTSCLSVLECHRCLYQERSNV
ncbi:hypothetical protein HAX54_027929, partial [Datura stramonium]|nr:hypothetical protein [Datura stramonium]